MAAWLNHFNQTWLIYALAIATTAFPILYAALAPWYRTWLGRAVMVLGIALALLLDLTILLRFIVLPPLAVAMITTGVLGLILAASVAKSIILIVTQVTARREKCILRRDERTD